MEATPDLSIVIPARNEARRLPTLLHSIRESLPDSGRTWEVLVVDHDSDDDTRAVAERAGAIILSAPDAGTVAAVRNAGAVQARGPWLAFLDADVTVTKEWARALDSLLERRPATARILSGCEVGGAGRGSWIERVWFDVHGKDRSHINSANLLVPRAFFRELGGFDGSLRTGEDFDLSRRAADAGGSLEPDDGFVASHDRYPTTLGAFFAREFWHGAGDFQSWRTLLRSTVAWLALSWLAVTAVAFVWTAFGASPSWLLVSPAWLAGIAGLAAVRRRKRSWLHLPGVWLLYVVYFASRAMSPIGLLGRGTGDAWRSRIDPPA